MSRLPFDVNICGLGELEERAKPGLSHVVSIMDPTWPDPPALASLPGCVRLELRFHDVIDAHGEDHVMPGEAHVARLLAFGRELPAGCKLLVHCHAGISRSTAAVVLLVAQAAPDLAADEILAEVVRVRPIAWPNLRMLELGDVMLRRDGTLVAAARSHYRSILDREPQRRTEMILGGRARETH